MSIPLQLCSSVSNHYHGALSQVVDYEREEEDEAEKEEPVYLGLAPRRAAPTTLMDDSRGRVVRRI